MATGDSGCEAYTAIAWGAVLLDALNRYRGKEGQQKVTVEHVDVHAAGRRWSAWSRARGEGINRNQRINPVQNKLPMHLSRRCGARKWLSMSDCNRTSSTDVIKK